MRITLNPNQKNGMCAPVIGYESENLVTEIDFDYSDWAEEFGEGVMTLAVKRAPSDEDPTPQPYPLTLPTTDDHKAVWNITELETAIGGRGEVQWIYTVGEKVKKSAIYEVWVDRSLNSTGDMPDPYISYFEQIVAVGAQATQDANRAEAAANSIKNLTAEANTLDAGSDATAEYDAETGVMTFGIPRGEKGDDGEAGMTPNIEVGNVETLETGQPAYANITGTDAEPRLNLGLPKGNTGDRGATGSPAGFGTVTATVDANTGTPSVDVTASGADTAKNFDFAFHNIKGETGETGPQGDPGVVQDVTVNGTSVLDGAVAKVVIPEITKTVTGNPIVIDDADGEVKALNVELTPIQDLNGYSKPWTGGAGTNKWDEEWEVGSIDPVTGDNATDNTRIRCKNHIAVMPSTSYYIKAPNTCGLRYYDSNKTFLGTSTVITAQNQVFTVPSNCYYIRFTVVGTTTYAHDIAINYPSTVTTYSPYENECPISPHTSVDIEDTNGTDTQTVTVPLNDLYGGNVDVIGGEDGKETWAIADLGTLNWTAYSIQNSIFRADIPNKKNAQSSAAPDNILCTIYPTVSGDSIIAATVDSAIGASTANGRIFVRDSRFTDATAFTQAMSGVQLCYELATPTPLTTTPTPLTLYKGDNVISSDGDMELTYVRNLQAVIDKIEAAL